MCIRDRAAPAPNIAIYRLPRLQALLPLCDMALIMVFAVRMCKSSEQRGYKFSKPKGEQKATVSITNKNLVDPIRAAMELSLIHI